MDIEIDITDPRVFAAVAYVIDQDDVQDRITAIRKSWKITAPISSEEFGRWIKEFHEDITLTPEAAETLEYATERLEIDSRHHVLTPLQELQMNKQLSEVRLIEYEIQYSLHVLRMSDFYYRILLKAVLCNKILEEDIFEVKKIQNDTKRYDFKKNDTEKFEAKMLGKVRKNDFLKKKYLEKIARNDTKKHFLADWLFEGMYKDEKIDDPFKGDTISNIKRNRRWYWMWREQKKQGRGAYGRILEAWNKEFPNEDLADINIIEHAVSSYRNFLKR